MEKHRPKAKEQPKVGKENSRRDFLKIAGVIAGVSAASTPLIRMLLSEKKEENEAFKSAVKEISMVLNDFYAQNTTSSPEEAVNKTEKLSEKIIAILKKHGLPAQEGENPQGRLMNFFQENGYVFAISPMAISSQSYVVNAPLHKIADTDYFDLSDLQFTGFPNSNTKVPVSTVEKTFVPDIRETQSFAGGQMIFDGMTMSNDQTGQSTVLIFPDKLQRIARESGLDPKKYRKTVELNEVSQVYFSEIIPVRMLGVPLAKLGIDTRGHDWTFLHVQEAFSDLASLKYSDTFDHELARILNTSAYQYDFSKAIAVASVNLGLENAGSRMQFSGRNFGEILTSLSRDQYDVLKITVVESYEANMAAVFSELLKRLREN